MQLNKAFTLLMTVILLLFMLIPSCVGQKTYTLKKGVGHFSIELPDGYKVSMVELREDHGYTNVSIDGPWNEQKQTYATGGILVVTANATYLNALSMLEH